MFYGLFSIILALSLPFGKREKRPPMRLSSRRGFRLSPPGRCFSVVPSPKKRALRQAGFAYHAGYATKRVFACFCACIAARRMAFSRVMRAAEWRPADCNAALSETMNNFYLVRAA